MAHALRWAASWLSSVRWVRWHFWRELSPTRSSLSSTLHTPHITALHPLTMIFSTVSFRAVAKSASIIRPPQLRSFSNNESKKSSSSSAMLQNIAMFALAGGIGYGAITFFNSSSSDDEESTSFNGTAVPPSADITSKVFFDISKQTTPNAPYQPIGRVVIGLYGTVVPRTVRNFQTLCEGTTIAGEEAGYRGSTFHRIIPQFMIQGGDFTRWVSVMFNSLFVYYWFPRNFNLSHYLYQIFYASILYIWYSYFSLVSMELVECQSTDTNSKTKTSN